jgi:hypothetical protein
MCNKIYGVMAIISDYFILLMTVLQETKNALKFFLIELLFSNSLFEETMRSMTSNRKRII